MLVVELKGGGQSIDTNKMRGILGLFALASVVGAFVAPQTNRVVRSHLYQSK
jgi:hypothetical protein